MPSDRTDAETARKLRSLGRWALDHAASDRCSLTADSTIGDAAWTAVALADWIEAGLIARTRRPA